jgi:putative addiction module component (TIGR02574 family)
MTKDARSVLDAALAFPSATRAAIARRLLASLDGPEPTPSERAEIDDAWDREIERRVKELDEGKAELVPYEQVMAEADRLLRDRKKRKKRA